MTDASGVTNYTYDNRDRLLTKATPFGRLTCTYDSASNILTLKSSNAGGGVDDLRLRSAEPICCRGKHIPPPSCRRSLRSQRRTCHSI